MTTTTFIDRVGAAPISWGICEAPGWGMQLPVDRVLREATDLGITAFEQGSLGWLPSDPAALRSTLDGYGMNLLGGFVALVLHDPAQSSAQLAEAERIATDMATAGGRFFVSCPVAFLDDWRRIDMTDANWSELFANLERVEEICSTAGLTQAVHPHIDTLIETDEDFTRFLDSCGVGFCFDTGHLTIGGADVVAIAKSQLDRISVVHLKDVDADAMARERSGELDLMQATQAGLFPSIGDGIVPIAEVIEVLESTGYDGWYVMETDVALTEGEPPAGEGPMLGVARSLDYLRSLSLPSVG